MNDYNPTDDLNAINVRWQVAVKRFKFWGRVEIALMFCMIGSLLYGISLPGSHWLMMPFFTCFILAAIGGKYPSLKAMRDCNASSRGINQRLRDNHYRLLTGEDRQ